MSGRLAPLNSVTRLSGAILIGSLLDLDVLCAAAWETIPFQDREELSRESDTVHLLDQLVSRRLLTPFQAEQTGRVGSPLGLIFGNYRVLESVDPTVPELLKAEHRRLKSTVTIRSFGGTHSSLVLKQFYDEIRVLMTCRHPGLAKVLDAGEQPNADSENGTVPYVVFEELTGQTLGEWVRKRGPLSVARACQVAHQLADALTESHNHGLFHRRLNPSTVFITPEGHAKIFDFGESSLTVPSQTLAGYIAPELADEPQRADPRCDLFSLAATLLFSLTGRPPFTPGGAQSTEVIPDELTAILNRMTDPDPNQRIASASALLRSLAPFLGWPSDRNSIATVGPITELLASRPTSILIVDDERHIRQIVRLALVKQAVRIEEADNGEDAVRLLTNQPFDLVLLDLDLPKLNGGEVLRRVRENPGSPHLKVIVVSGQGDGDHLSGTISAGADDFLTKPFSVVQLRARVTSALRLKQAQDHSELLTRRLATCNAELELAFNARGGELVHARGALVLALAKLVEQRSSETGPHLLRLQRYSRILGEAAAATPAFAARLTPEILQTIQQAAPLHDIGKVAVPDHILNKPGALTAEERTIMQSHAAAGADTLAFVTNRFAFATGFFSTAIEIARHHHEKWDGTGYPDQLAGESIPLSARIVALGDVYDALRSRRVYKVGESHADTVRCIVENSPGHFDPRLLEVFARIHEQFRDAFDECGD
jgi:putative two-component system response regulator